MIKTTIRPYSFDLPGYSAPVTVRVTGAGVRYADLATNYCGGFITAQTVADLRAKLDEIEDARQTETARIRQRRDGAADSIPAVLVRADRAERVIAHHWSRVSDQMIIITYEDGHRDSVSSQSLLRDLTDAEAETFQTAEKAYSEARARLPRATYLSDAMELLDAPVEVWFDRSADEWVAETPVVEGDADSGVTERAGTAREAVHAVQRRLVADRYPYTLYVCPTGATIQRTHAYTDEAVLLFTSREDAEAWLTAQEQVRSAAAELERLRTEYAFDLSVLPVPVA